VDPDYAASPPVYDGNRRLYVIEFAGGEANAGSKPEVTANAGKIANVHLMTNDAAKTLRLSFEHDVTGVDVAELRAILRNGDKKVSETWLYRWTRS